MSNAEDSPLRGKGTDRFFRSPRVRWDAMRASSILNALPVCISYVDLEHRYRFNNKTYERWFRRPADELLGKHVSEVIGTEAYQNLRPYYEELVTARREVAYEGRFDLPDLPQRWLHLRFTPDVDGSGEVRGFFVVADDVTEFREAADEISRQALVFEHMHDAVVLSDVGARVIDWNPAAQRLFGYAKEEIVGRGTGRLFRAGSLSELEAKIRDEIARNRIWQGQVTFVRKDGSSGIADAIVIPAPASNAPAESFIGVYRDVTEREAVQAALRENEEKFRTLAETTPAATFIFQGDRLVYVNSTAERLTGYTRAELLAGRFWDAVPADSSAFVAARGRARRSGEEVPEEFELKIVDKSGKDRWVSFTTSIISFAGRPAILGTGFEITSRKFAERALAESHNLLQAVIEGTPDAVFVKDSERRYLMMNAAGARLFGRAAEEIVGLQDVDLFPPEEAVEILQDDQKVMDEAREHTWEEARTIAGVTHTFLTIKAPWFDDQGHVIGLIGIARDITARQSAQDDIWRHHAELAHLLRLQTVGEMAAGLAHELNQPLAAIVNYAHGCLLRLEAGQSGEAEVRSVLESIADQALRGGAIVRGLREFVRNEPSGREVVRVDELIDGTVRLIEPRTRQDEVRLSVDTKATHRVRAVRVQIEQVLLNLLLNGLDAMQEGRGGERSLHISSAEVDDHTLEVVVSDTGRGLQKDQIEEIFKPFFTTKKKGLGMGLAISRSIVEAHGGRLWAVPQKRGTSFHLRLPLPKRSVKKRRDDAA